MVNLSKSAVPTDINYSVRLSHNPNISIGGAHNCGDRLCPFGRKQYDDHHLKHMCHKSLDSRHRGQS